ncbi:MAG: GHKL domain-containing protein [Chitinispirillales bacterium]|jgi:two-component system phosphate regulon sensor histidine kinase PhoR|nr:GHKL domain-containing protein [Chitinispirillales bacterium]
MKKIVFAAICVLSVTAITITALLVNYAAYSDYENHKIKNESQLLLKMINNGIDAYGTSYLDSIHIMQHSILYIDKNGNVLKTTKESERFNPIGKKILYQELRRYDGSTIRVIICADEYIIYARKFIPVLIFMVILTSILAMVAAKTLSKKIVGRINGIDMENPHDSVIFDELSPLMHKIKNRNDSFAVQLDNLKNRKTQFETITANMQDGLIILNENDRILFCNKKAINILSRRNNEDDNFVNRNILVLCRDEKFRSGMKFTPETTKQESLFEMHGGTIKMIASRITNNERKIGTAVLLMDITEQADREKLRREFSANVSHELKTPLTIISGYSEIMANGMAKPEDITDFAKKIHSESQRLLSLINDIIQLSNLDENSSFEFEKVDLYDFVKDAISKIKEKADDKKISYELNGKNVCINAVPRLLYEILQNLLDNAVKYNRENGKIFVEIKTKEDKVVLSVTDTGIGIPLSMQRRVFERFFRVDSSRTGRQSGTGLGLSIVKHAVDIHKGEINLSSVEEKWTKVVVKFPLVK